MPQLSCRRCQKPLPSTDCTVDIMFDGKLMIFKDTLQCECGWHGRVTRKVDNRETGKPEENAA